MIVTIETNENEIEKKNQAAILKAAAKHLKICKADIYDNKYIIVKANDFQNKELEEFKKALSKISPSIFVE